VRRLYAFVRGALAALGLLFLIVTLTPIDFWWLMWLQGPRNDPRGDIMIVPGADIQDDATVGPTTYWRTVYAERIWHEGGWREVVVTGGGQLATGMRDFLIQYGVPATAIVLENGSTTTRQNALYTEKILHGAAGAKVLVTSDYHMYRAVRTFRRAGLDVQPRPIPDMIKRISSPLKRWQAFLDLCVETAKIGGYKIRGWA